ncbi:MAG: DUF3006 domain-containing protein [Eubacteriales bacterium]
MFIIDRIENNWAVIEGKDRLIFNVPFSILPLGSKEGDVLNISITKDLKETENRQINSSKLLINFFDE